MKKKARFIRRYYGTGYDKDFVYLEYEYRGKRYEVYENMAKGNEPLSWQHATEQARIDKQLDSEDCSVQEQAEDIDKVIQDFLDFCEK